MPTLTIFTATYNRRKLIGRLYESLTRQHNYDFEWLVVDDGSTDGTDLYFEDLLVSPQPFLIRYYHQDNQGLIRSLNKGISLAEGKYFSKIDSDDYVVDDFVETMLSWIDEVKGQDKIYAVGGVRILPDGSPLKGTWPLIDIYLDASDIERPKYNLDADMTEAWRLDVLRNYVFPVWPGEKFAPEQLVLHRIAMDGYLIRWRPKGLVICEYQEGGLTRGADKLVKDNPMGYAMMWNQMTTRSDIGFFNRIKASANFIAQCLLGHNLSFILKAERPFLSMMAFLPGFFLSFRRKRQLRSII